MSSNNNSNNKDRKGNKRRKMKISRFTTLFIQPFQEDDLID